jgi:hypothetical protein
MLRRVKTMLSIKPDAVNTKTIAIMSAAAFNRIDIAAAPLALNSHRGFLNLLYFTLNKIAITFIIREWQNVDLIKITRHSGLEPESLSLSLF